jgi:NAD(P)H dehydrogenase (quinone)
MVATPDVGRLVARCLVEPPRASEVVDLLGPACTMREVASKVGGLLGKAIDVVEVPPAGHVEALVAAGLPRPFAAAVAELMACFAAGRIAPRGDRALFGTTTVDDVLPGLM